jgi:hypothetical protein
MATGRLISTRTEFASFASLIADVRTFTAGTALYIPSIGAEYVATESTGNLGQTNASGQEINVVDPLNRFNPSQVGDSITAATTLSLGGSLRLPASAITGIDAALTPDTSAINDKVAITGEGMRKTLLTFDDGVDGLHRRDSSILEHFSMTSDSLAKADVAISTAGHGLEQSYFGKMSDMYFRGWRYGVWNRYSLWDSYRNVRSVDNTCHFRFARADYQADNADPTAGAWNVLDGSGVYNNQITMDNVLCDRGEVGVWGSLMGSTLINVTTQGQETAGGGSNDVLATNSPGTGILLDGRGNGDRLWQNVVINHYAENTDLGAYYKDQRHVAVHGMFMQGGPAGDDRAVAAVVADNSEVDLTGFTGQDYFTTLFEAKNGGVLYITGEHGPTIQAEKYKTDATSRIKPRGRVDSDKFEYFIDKVSSGAQVFTLPEEVGDYSVSYVYIVGIYDGYSMRGGTAAIYRRTSTSAAVVEWIGTQPTGMTVNCSTAGVVTVGWTSSLPGTADVTLHKVAGRDISGTKINVAED